MEAGSVKIGAHKLHDFRSISCDCRPYLSRGFGAGGHIRPASLAAIAEGALPDEYFRATAALGVPIHFALFACQCSGAIAIMEVVLVKRKHAAARHFACNSRHRNHGVEWLSHSFHR
jgi:hypothetical protein